MVDDVVGIEVDGRDRRASDMVDEVAGSEVDGRDRRCE